MLTSDILKCQLCFALSRGFISIFVAFQFRTNTYMSSNRQIHEAAYPISPAASGRRCGSLSRENFKFRLIAVKPLRPQRPTARFAWPFLCAPHVAHRQRLRCGTNFFAVLQYLSIKAFRLH